MVAIVKSRDSVHESKGPDYKHDLQRERDLAKAALKREFALGQILGNSKAIKNLKSNLGRDLTLTYLGGGHYGPPPVVFLTVRLYHSKFRTLLSGLFSFKFPAHFDTKFVTPGGTVLKLRNFLYMHVGPKMAPKCDFVYKINAN